MFAPERSSCIAVREIGYKPAEWGDDGDPPLGSEQGAADNRNVRMLKREGMPSR
jgi:hypothetical protein